MIHPTFDAQTLARITRSVKLWEEAGASFVSLPWTAPRAIIESTRPMWAGKDTQTQHDFLVASGEQSFLWLDEEGRLPENKLCVGWSPCFRDEHNFDDIHNYYFLKAEVYRRLGEGEDGERVLEQIVHTAACIMETIGGVRPTKVVMAPWQIDLELAGLEVGSYGCRPRPNGRPYLYATALAEPRFSLALAAAEEL
jgi:hypothetical protein